MRADWLVRFLPRDARPVVVIAAAMCLQLTYGIVYTFGNLLPYLVSYLRWHVNPLQTYGTMIWLQSFMTLVPFGMFVGGFLERKWGVQVGALCGTVIYTGSLALSYFSIQQSFCLLLLSFGLAGSLGHAISYNCVLIQAQRWLPNNIGLASGLITAGFGCGGFVMSPIETVFINPNNYMPNAEGYFTQIDLLERVPRVFLLLSALFVVVQTVALCVISDPPEWQRPSGKQGRHIDWEGIGRRVTSGTFIIIFASMMCNDLWIQLSAGLFKAYGQTFIHDDFFLASVSSFAAASNCLSRIFWGALLDKTSYQTAMCCACTLGAALMWTLGVVRYLQVPWLFLLWVCGLFSVTGATFSMIPTVIYKCFGPAEFGLLYGATQAAISIGGLASAMMAQFLLPVIGFERFFLLFGFLPVVTFVLTTCIQCTEYGRGDKPKAEIEMK